MSDGEHGISSFVSINGTTIGNIISIGGPELGRDSLDVSTMDSTAKFREFIPGMIDAGEITMEINYDGTAAGTGNMLSAQMTATTSSIIVSIGADSSTWTCNGFMTGLGHAIPFDDKITQSVTIKLTGQPTYTDLA